MALLSDDTLARLADLAQTLVLVDTCDILRETRSAQSSSGGYSTTYPPVNPAPLPCAVVASGQPSELVLAAQEVGFVPVTILLPLETDILGSDRIRVTARTTGQVTTYHVIDFPAAASFDVVKRVTARQASLVG